MRAIDLTKTILSSDRVVTGLKFHKSKVSNRINLSLFSAKFNFNSGHLIDALESQQNLEIPHAGKYMSKLSYL